MSTDHEQVIISPRPLFPNQQQPSPTTSYFLPPTPPPASSSSTPTHSRRTSPKRPIMSASAAMTWLSHKSSNSIASLRSRTDSFNKDRHQQQPSIHTLKISDPIPIGEELPIVRPKPSAPLQLAPAPRLGNASEAVGFPSDPAVERVISPPPKRVGELPPIPQSPPSAGGFSLRSSKSSPHLKSPTTALTHHHHTRTASELSLRSPPARRANTNTIVIPPLTPPTSQIDASTIPAIQPQPKFSAVLLSSNLDVPLSAGGRPKPQHHHRPTPKSPVIITLETSTEVFKTTLSTLTSRPSYAAAWFDSIVRGGEGSSIIDELSEVDDRDADPEREPASTTSSVPPSPFTRVFQDHLTSQGLRPTLPSYREMHVFMDRPSAPYPHILNFLRSPPESAVLPRAVQLAVDLSSSSSVKLDALLDLRDEAAFLGLDALVGLCEVELRRWAAGKRTSAEAKHKHSQSTGTATSTTVGGGASSRPTSAEVPAPAPINTNVTALVGRQLRKAASHRILSPTAVPESIDEDDGDALQSDTDYGTTTNATNATATNVPHTKKDQVWTEFGVRPPSTSEVSSEGGSTTSSGVYDDTHNQQQQQQPVRTTSPETITRATAAAAGIVTSGHHVRSRSSSAIPFTSTTTIPPSRGLPDVPSSPSMGTPIATLPPASTTPLGLSLRSRKMRSRSNSRGEAGGRPTIVPPASIVIVPRDANLSVSVGAGGVARGGGPERHQKGNSFLPSLMSPSTPKTASSSNWI